VHWGDGAAVVVAVGVVEGIATDPSTGSCVGSGVLLQLQEESLTVPSQTTTSAYSTVAVAVSG
jgi:predicted aconitase with swiveling domain